MTYDRDFLEASLTVPRDLREDANGPLEGNDLVAR
jgi:hypothetical protein